jgi:glucosamine 6-phosphate synthetase-like amidotransferase/phosphosugar isomerase protein
LIVCSQTGRRCPLSPPSPYSSYYIAVEIGWDVDKPRNLAKSVTVE